MGRVWNGMGFDYLRDLLAAGLHLFYATLVSARYVAMTGCLVFIGGISEALGIFLREFLLWSIVGGTAAAVFMIATVTFRLISAEDRRRLALGMNRSYVKTFNGVDGYVQ